MLFFVLAFAFSWVVWAPAVFLFPHGASEPLTTSAALLHLVGSLGPMVSAFVVTALVGGSAGVRELLGRGFALPRLQTGRRSALVAALILSLFWAGWHIPLFTFVMGFKGMGLAAVAGWFFSILTGSVLLAWLYNGTGGSILIVAIFHGTLDITISSPSGPELANVMGALVTIWGLAILVWGGPKNLSRQRRKQEAPDLSAPGEARVV